jgi:hypothetical protein
MLVRGTTRAGAARSPAGPTRPLSPPPPPSRRNPGRSCSGPGRTGPAFVAATSFVALHPGPEPFGARPARPERRRVAIWAGAARGGSGPAFVFNVVAAFAAHSGPESPGARSSRPGLRLHRPRRRGAPRAGAVRGPAGLARPGLLLLTLRFVISCAISSSYRANGRTQPEWAGRGSAPAARRDLSSCACAFTRWSLPAT